MPFVGVASAHGRMGHKTAHFTDFGSILTRDRCHQDVVVSVGMGGMGRMYPSVWQQEYIFSYGAPCALPGQTAALM